MNPIKELEKATMEIKCSRSTTIVDADDYPLLSRYKWTSYPCNHGKGTWYAQTVIRGKSIPMARFILGSFNKRFIADHINGNGMDNRKSNLRLCSPSRNLQNRSAWKNRKFKGVYRNKSSKKFCVQITHNKKNHYFGGFISDEEAARFYDKKALEFFGEYAKLNFPIQKYKNIQDCFLEVQAKLAKAEELLERAEKALEQVSGSNNMSMFNLGQVNKALDQIHAYRTGKK